MEPSSQQHSVKTYGQIAVILCVVTFIEWAIFKVESLRSSALFLLPTLIALSVAKFVLVCGWYMHLRHEPKILTRIFVFSLILAFLVMAVIVWLKI